MKTTQNFGRTSARGQGYRRCYHCADHCCVKGCKHCADVASRNHDCSCLLTVSVTGDADCLKRDGKAHHRHQCILDNEFIEVFNCVVRLLTLLYFVQSVPINRR